MTEIKIKLDSLSQGIQHLQDGTLKRVEFDLEVKEAGKYKARMYKITDRIIRIDLKKVTK